MTMLTRSRRPIPDVLAPWRGANRIATTWRTAGTVLVMCATYAVTRFEFEFVEPVQYAKRHGLPNEAVGIVETFRIPVLVFGFVTIAIGVAMCLYAGHKHKVGTESMNT
jgi:hypothetical protein